MMQQTQENKSSTPIKPILVERKQRFYEKYIKRLMDIICSLLAFIVFSWLYLIIAVLVRVKLGSPVLFKQHRPGKIDPKTGHEKIFYMYKFRSMSDERGENGTLLPDEVRLGKFGKALRATSLDELPEAFNILKGDMSVIGPRPQLVRDMVFMTDEQRQRHTVRPGLSGLAQTRGRNALSWDDKLATDLEYIENITFTGDMMIIFDTVKQVFFRRKGLENNDVDEVDITDDFGDYLLKSGRVSKEEYEEKQVQAHQLFTSAIGSINMEKNISNISSQHPSFSVAISVYKNDNPVFFDRALYSVTELQTIRPDEVVLVVDGPISNDLNTVIEKYENKYPFFKVIRLEQNSGLGNALKIAVENAGFELIARMDSDDVSVPTRFEQQLKYFEQYPQISIVGGDITEFVGEEPNIVGKRIVPQSNAEIREYMKKRCAFNHVSVMYKKTAVEAAGGYQDWFWNEDYYLWIRMWLNNAVFANTGTVLVNVRVGEEMYQRRGGKRYFESEKGLQDYMLRHKMIGAGRYIVNVSKRFIVQKIFPNSVRGWVFRAFARK